MKREYEDPSLELIGRSAAERRLDRIYNRQRSKLPKRETKPGTIVDETCRLKKALPFQSKEQGDAISESASQDASSSRKKGPKEILMDIAENHMPRRSRLAKSIQLLTKFSVSYLDDPLNPEFSGIDLNVLMGVYAKLNRIFVSQFDGGVPSDSNDVKTAVKDFMDKVVDRLEKDHSLTTKELRFIELLKLSIGYPAALWLENDSFRYHAIISKLESHLTNFESISSQATYDHRENETAIVTVELEGDKDEPSNLKEGQTSSDSKGSACQSDDQNLVGAANYTNATSERDTTEQPDATVVQSDNVVIKNNLELQHSLPSEEELIESQKQAFVRTLAVVFGFFTFTWAKVSIETLFQRVYLKRDMFAETEQKRITEWQQQIKASRGKSSKQGGTPALGMAQAKFEVKDAREEKIFSTHGSQVWCNRQYGI